MELEKYEGYLDYLLPKYYVIVSSGTTFMKKSTFLELQNLYKKEKNHADILLRLNIASVLDKTFNIQVEELNTYVDLDEFFMIKGGIKAFSDKLGITVKELFTYMVYCETSVRRTNKTTRKLYKMLHPLEFANFIYTLLYNTYTNKGLPVSYINAYSRDFMEYLPLADRVDVYLGELPRLVFYTSYLNFNKNYVEMNKLVFLKNVIRKFKEKYPEYEEYNIKVIPYVRKEITKGISSNYGSVTNFIKDNGLTHTRYTQLLNLQKVDNSEKIKVISEASGINFASLVVSLIVNKSEKLYLTVPKVFNKLCRTNYNRINRELKYKSYIEEKENDRG